MLMPHVRRTPFREDFHLLTLGHRKTYRVGDNEEWEALV